jgi:hypothetical protein
MLVDIKLYDILNFYPEDGSNMFLRNVIYKTARHLTLLKTEVENSSGMVITIYQVISFFIPET